MNQMELFDGSSEFCGRLGLDRGDADVLAARVQTEIHRLVGLLRFSPDSAGVYIARCAPDYFILPALADHFTRRFGEIPWVIIDERRGICLSCENGGPVRLITVSAGPSAEMEKGTEDSWEELWRLHHSSLSNEARKNPRLQRQFMPTRYHKYLPEMK